jgi:polyhydroxybutyrate depolymerase
MSNDEFATRTAMQLALLALAATGCSSDSLPSPDWNTGTGGASITGVAGSPALGGDWNSRAGSGTGGSMVASATPKATGGATGLERDGSADADLPDVGTDLARGGLVVGDWRSGDYPPDITSQNYLELKGVKGQGSYVRQYKVHVPPGYDPTVPTPVVFCIHGLAQNSVMFCVTGAALDKKSDAAGFILVMPNGYQNSWNAGTCCGGASNEKLDDVALFRAIFAEVDHHLNVDHRRVYATGLSNGGYMSYRLACEASDLFAAIAPGAGAVGINSIGGGTNASSDFTTCDPKEAVSVLDTHGTADPLIPYSLQAPSLTLFSGKDGCGTTTLPATSPKSAGDTTCVTYAQCPAGIEVTGCSVSGGGHCWFGSPDCGTGAGIIGAAFVGANSNSMMNTDAVWDFFSRSVKKTK